MRDFQTWLITQVMVARGPAFQVISELPVCALTTLFIPVRLLNRIINHT